MTHPVEANVSPYGLAPWTLARFRAAYGFCPSHGPLTPWEPIVAQPLASFVTSYQDGLTTGVTHVALLDTRALTETSIAERYLAHLPAATQARLARIHHPERRAESLGGRLLAASFARILGQTLREDPPYAPLLETSESATPCWDVSLAHSQGIAALALEALPLGTARPQVALDLERVRPRPTIREIVTHSLGDAFWERLATVASPEDPHATLLTFYRLWGEYECAIKLSRFSTAPYRVRQATCPEDGFTLYDPQGKAWANQAFMLAAPTRDVPLTPFVLTVAQRQAQPVNIYHLTLNDALAYVD